MMISRPLVPYIVLLLLGLLVSGCGAQPTEVSQTEDSFLLALPRIEVVLDRDGVPSVEGLDAQTLKSITGGLVDLTWAKFPPGSIAQLVNSGIQHIELIHKDDGLFFFLNGEPLPHLAWSGESLSATGKLLGDAGIIENELADLINLFIPFAQRIGLDVAIRFPVPEGVESLPLRDLSAPVASSILAEEDESESSFAVRLEINYDEAGEAQLPGPAFILENLLGLPIDGLNLSPETISRLIGLNIQHVTIRTAPNGLLLYVNGEALPHIAWGEQDLEAATSLLGTLYGGDDSALLSPVLDTFLPFLAQADIELTLRFPLGPSATPIAVPGS